MCHLVLNERILNVRKVIKLFKDITLIQNASHFHVRDKEVHGCAAMLTARYFQMIVSYIYFMLRHQRVVLMVMLL